MVLKFLTFFSGLTHTTLERRLLAVIDVSMRSYPARKWFIVVILQSL